MAAHCPQCFIRLPLSGEANCDCEPPSAPGKARTAHLSASGPVGALPDLLDAERVCEVMFMADEDVATLDAIRARQC